MEVWCKPVKMEIVENGGYISMDEDHKENTPLLPDVTTTGKRGEGKVLQPSISKPRTIFI
jgi:hypothetical protein